MDRQRWIRFPLWRLLR